MLPGVSLASASCGRSWLNTRRKRSTRRGNGCGGIVAVLVTIQKANPATEQPTIYQRKIFATFQLLRLCSLLRIMNIQRPTRKNRRGCGLKIHGLKSELLRIVG